MILACDPGLSGAFALLNPEPLSLTVHAIPTMKRQISGKLRDVIDENETIALVQGYFAGAFGVDRLYIERVNGMPGQSGPAAFSFGYGYGVVKTAALAAGMTVVEIPAAEWKNAMKAPRDKKASRARAGDLLPGFAHLWPLAKDDGKAEAAMLALYGARLEARR